MSLNQVQMINKNLSPKFMLSYSTVKNIITAPTVAKFSTKPSRLDGPSMGFDFSGKNYDCTHEGATFGHRVPGDLQTFVHVVKKDKIWFRKRAVQVQYPSKNKETNNCVITFINVVNLYKGCNCYKDTIRIVDGGVGKKYVKMKITSEASCPTEYKISCFTKC